MGGGGGQHLDTVQFRRHLLLRYLLPILKSTQAYDQSTLDSISVFKDIGANAGVLSGFLYSAVSHRRHLGPWVVHAAGAIQCFVGYFFMWLAVTGAIARPNVVVMCVFMFVASHAQTFFNTANVVTSVHNFPDYSGTMVGIMKGFLGLSAAIIIQVYQTFFAGKPATFLLMLAVAPPLLTLLLMFFVRIDHTTQTQSSDQDKRYLNAFSFISVIVAAYLMFLIFLNNTVVLPHWGRALTLALLLLLIASPLFIAIKAHQHHLQALQSPLKTPLIKEDPESVKPENPATDHVNVNANGEQQHKEIASADAGEDLNLLQAMSTLNFWLLFVAMLCGLGSGLATVNNISQIGESLGYTARERSTMVSLWSMELSWAVRGGICVRHFHAQEGVAEAVVHDNHTGNNGCRPCNDRVGVPRELIRGITVGGSVFRVAVVVDADDH
ncbi:UNVERIFIED_CONTAM: hypothetical protein Scaly_1438000 [Sesamum calycinum]|uniref:Nodulin-like domain-containing protein n=1 Tax=Sesamum calycinum TaxID=2727403 RepID=A0AAW2PNM9_9LAMI